VSAHTPLARARGLGAAHDGLGHWKAQRLTALANGVLVLWFVFSAAALAGAGYDEVILIRLLVFALAVACIVAVLTVALGS
jgi:succinate dehydrogenase / fumarate reductase membrane anchor subunit